MDVLSETNRNAQFKLVCIFRDVRPEELQSRGYTYVCAYISTFLIFLSAKAFCDSRESLESEIFVCLNLFGEEKVLDAVMFWKMGLSVVSPLECPEGSQASEKGKEGLEGHRGEVERVVVVRRWLLDGLGLKVFANGSFFFAF